MTPDEVLRALRSGDSEAVLADADPGFRSAVSPGELTRVWAAVTAELGDLVSSGTADVLHDVPLRFTRGEAHLQVAYRDGVVAGLVLRPGPPTGRFGE